MPRYLMACAVLFLTGCGSGHVCEFEGYIGTPKKIDLTASILCDGFASKDEITPISGATVFLSLSRDEPKPINSYTVTSGEDGGYQLKQTMPKGNTPVFLIVKHPKYELLVQSVNCEVRGKYFRQNIVMLKEK